MNFELKAMGLAGVSNEKCDALIVLVPQDFKAGKDDLSVLIAQTLKAGDLEAKSGKTLCLYRPTQANAARVVLASVGAGAARDVRGAVLAAVAAGACVSYKEAAKQVHKESICYMPKKSAAIEEKYRKFGILYQTMLEIEK